MMLFVVFEIAKSFLLVPYGSILTMLLSIVNDAGSLEKSFFTVPNLPLTDIVLSSKDTEIPSGISRVETNSLVDVPN